MLACMYGFTQQGVALARVNRKGGRANLCRLVLTHTLGKISEQGQDLVARVWLLVSRGGDLCAVCVVGVWGSRWGFWLLQAACPGRVTQHMIQDLDRSQV